MSQGITVEAVRLALTVNELRAKVASQNIAQANTPGARAMHVDMGAVQPALDAAVAGIATPEGLQHAIDAVGTASIDDSAPIELDAQVAEMVAASTNYQALTEALGRHFSLMRLAISGKS